MFGVNEYGTEECKKGINGCGLWMEVDARFVKNKRYP
jgi:hypothetical protein